MRASGSSCWLHSFVGFSIVKGLGGLLSIHLLVMSNTQEAVSTMQGISSMFLLHRLFFLSLRRWADFCLYMFPRCRLLLSLGLLD